MNHLVKEFEMIAEETDNVGITDKGAKTLLSSTDYFTDLFSLIGSCRGIARREDAEGALVDVFNRCYAKDSKLALRIALWARDVRGGAGERAVFRQILSWLSRRGSKKDLINLIDSGIIEEVGRWDDYVGLMVDSDVVLDVRQAAANHILHAINAGNGLACKWLPRKGANAAKIRALFKMSPKTYRKTIVAGTKVVETQMCAKDWDGINYSHVPSVAMARYTNAFNRNSLTAFPEYKSQLESGEVKAKATALFPYDVIRTAQYGDAAIADAQWNELPNFIDNDAVLLPIIDVSGSMCVNISGSMTAMDIATSLGIYLAERNKSAFRNLFLTFHETPKMVRLKDGTIADKNRQVREADWGGTTNLQASFDLILNTAVKAEVPASEMPKYLFIISDMEFDEATGKDCQWGRIPTHAVTNFESIEEKYRKAGYERPNIIFWNVDARLGNVQVKSDKHGTAMISGFSPSIVRPILNAEAITPRGIMEQTVMVPRYDVDGLTI